MVPVSAYHDESVGDVNAMVEMLVATGEQTCIPVSACLAVRFAASFGICNCGFGA
jgi:hypothetical protein